MKSCIVGIDASRNRSGGARHHLVGLLGAVDPRDYGIDAVHVWAYRKLLDALPDLPWLHRHNPPQLEGSLLTQMAWQRWSLGRDLERVRCSVLLSTDAGTVGTFEPSIVMSRDMLSYEPGEMRRYGVSRAWLRLLLLRYVQARSLRRARGAVFLTRYAADTIQAFTGRLGNVAVIPHGVGDGFRAAARDGSWRAGDDGEIRIVYVSNAEMYKHQWNVVRAAAALRHRGYRVNLTLVGGGEGSALALLERAVAESDPGGAFVRVLGATPHANLPALLRESDLFVFASSCENMPNTLLEGMASGLPIACSDRGPMPEVLGDGGVYFDPERPEQIADALQRLITDRQLRIAVAERAKRRADQFSWARCARETWAFLRTNAVEATQQVE